MLLLTHRCRKTVR